MHPYQAPAQLLQQRVILITGAGQGIGRSAALSFAAHGATVILLGRKLAKLEAVYDDIMQAGGPQPAIFPLDLAETGAAEFAAMADGIHQQLGRLDGILHNATAFEALTPMELHSMEQFERMLRVNVSAPFALTKACLPLLLQAPDASVLFTSTSAVAGHHVYWGAHGVSKAALEHLVRTWAPELEKTPQLRLNAVVPGALQSPQRKATHPGEIHDALPAIDSVMATYLYLMGPDSRGVSGQVLQAQPATVTPG